MALGLEKQQSARKRKRKGTKIKLYLHEKVEVIIITPFLNDFCGVLTPLSLFLIDYFFPDDFLVCLLLFVFNVKF